MLDKKPFYATCVGIRCEEVPLLHYLDDHSVQISRATFLKHADVPPEAVRLHHNPKWYGTFYYRCGPVYWYDWSAIHHVFATHEDIAWLKRQVEAELDEQIDQLILSGEPITEAAFDKFADHLRAKHQPIRSTSGSSARSVGIFDIKTGGWREAGLVDYLNKHTQIIPNVQKLNQQFASHLNKQSGMTVTSYADKAKAVSFYGYNIYAEVVVNGTTIQPTVQIHGVNNYLATKNNMWPPDKWRLTCTWYLVKGRSSIKDITEFLAVYLRQDDAAGVAAAFKQADELLRGAALFNHVDDIAEHIVV